MMDLRSDLREIKHKLIDTFTESTLAIKVQTSIGKTTIGTIYQPPRRPYLRIEDTKII